MGFNYRVFDKHGTLLAATVDPEEAAAIISLRGEGGIVRAGRTVVWTEGDEVCEAGDSYDTAGHIMWLRREIARSRKDPGYVTVLEAEYDVVVNNCRARS